ncbi:MAG: hypothetical protein QM820_21545 [Minicystis sp.]
MATNTAEDLYALVLQLPAAERLRLVEKIAHDLSAAAPKAQVSSGGAEPAGAATGPSKSALPTLPRDAWEAALGSVALGGDALADSEAYCDAP